MRKGQIHILKKARRHGCTEKELEFLSDDKKPLRYLEILESFFSKGKGMEKEERDLSGVYAEHAYQAIQENCFTAFEKEKLMITPDGKIFWYLNRHYVPAPFHLLYRLAYKDSIVEMRIILESILEKAGTLFFKDLVNDAGAYGDVLVPVSFNNLVKFHSRKQFFLSYKSACGLSVEWNRININLGYLIMHSIKYVAHGKSRNILLQCRNFCREEAFHRVEKTTIKDMCVLFLGIVIAERIRSSSGTDRYDEVLGYSSDYVRVCIHSGCMVRLSDGTLL